MGEEIKIIDVQAENGGTVIQVDIQSDKGKDRLFINTRDIFRAINNYIYEAQDKALEEMGFVKTDPDAKNLNLI